MELGLGSLWLEAGVGSKADDHWSLEPAYKSGLDVATYPLLLPPNLGEHVEQNVSLATFSDARLRRSVRVTVLRRADVCAFEPGPAPRKHAPPQAVYPRRLMGSGGLSRHAANPGPDFRSSSSSFLFLPEKMNRHRITLRKDEPTPDYPRKDELTPDYPRAPTLAATPQQQRRAQDPDESFPNTSPLSTISAAPFLWNPAHRVQAVNCVSIPTLAGSRPGSRHIG